jgi:hypothetical protein
MEQLTGPTYRVAISIHRRTASPFRVTEVSPQRTYEIVDSFLAAWGIPKPHNLRDPAAFVQGLVDFGGYQHEADDYRIIVERNP